MTSVAGGDARAAAAAGLTAVLPRGLIRAFRRAYNGARIDKIDLAANSPAKPWSIDVGTIVVYLVVTNWPAGTRAPFRTTMPADAGHKSGSSPYSYFKVTL